MDRRLSLFPTLQLQREIYAMPRSVERFRHYLATLTGGTDDLAVPIVTLNPMGKEHVAQVVDGLIAIDAEAEVDRALAEAEQRLGSVSVDLRVSLVVADDVAGSWTGRELIEAHRICRRPDAVIKRNLLEVPYWASETASTERVRHEVLAAIYRVEDQLRHQAPTTLGHMMALEGSALAFSDATAPARDADDLAYSRSVIEPHLDSTQFPTIFSCLFGDAAARRFGYEPFGLSHRAGLAVALADARADTPRSDSARLRTASTAME